MQLDKSRELYQRARKSMAAGVSSNMRSAEQPGPLFFEHAKGSRLYDVDGNAYIDYMMGMGPAVFGHAPDFLIDSVAKQLAKGQTFAGQNELEISVAEAVQKAVPSAELVRYAGSGTEAVQAALRIARSYTGKTKFIKFEGQYHGWMDSVLYSRAGLSADDMGPYDSPTPVPGSAGLSPGSANEIIVLPWNDIDLLTRTLDLHHQDIAAIITEPITSSIMPKPGYLEAMRELCDERGIVLIFDEVITGFRVALGGAQSLLGVTPDISTFAKAMAGGFPMAMVAGKHDMMNLLDDGTTMHAGTLNGNLVSMAAAQASLNKLSSKDGAIYKRLYSTSTKLMEGIREMANRHELDVLVYGPGPVFSMAFTAADGVTNYRDLYEGMDNAMWQKFYLGMLERGVRLGPHGMWLISAAHTDADIDETISAVNETMEML